MRRRSWFGVAAAAGLSPLAARAQLRDLTVVSWGGVYQDIQREVYFRPWIITRNDRLLEETWEGGLATLRGRAQTGASSWDIVQVEAEELLLGCAEGLFEPLDFSEIGGAESYIPAAVHDCGVGAILYSFVLAWDRTRLREAPQGWADLFDTARFPGRRAMRRGPKATLEIALMGDGVNPGEVYRTLATEAGLARAFRKLESIRDDLQWWDRGSQPQQWLASNEVALSVAYNGRIAAVNANDNRDFGIAWNGNLLTMDSWVVMRGTPNRMRAMDFLAFVGQPQVQALLPPRIPYAVTARGAPALLTRDVLLSLPTAQGHADVALPIDATFWAANIDRLTARFVTWLGR